MKHISPVGIPKPPVVLPDERLQMKPAQLRREHEREPLKIRVGLQIQNTEIRGYTHDVSPSGLRLIAAIALKAGTPLALQYSFSETCYLDLSGQVIWCYRVEDETSHLHSIGIKFAAVRELEGKILGPMIQDLKENRSIVETSLLTLRVSEDSLASA